eukprot:12390968-Karenia_brevis.AAC.1
MSVVYTTIRMPVSSPYFKKSKEATENFEKLQKKLKSQNKTPEEIKNQIATPNVHSFAAMVQ